MVSKGLYGMLGIELGSALLKVSALPTVLSLWPLCLHLLSHRDRAVLRAKEGHEEGAGPGQLRVPSQQTWPCPPAIMQDKWELPQLLPEQVRDSAGTPL